MIKKPINKIVQYKGGGYDGCFWEWNYAYFDKKGEFHNIQATGYKGCKTKGDMLNYIDCEREGTDYFLVRAGMKSSLFDFYKESNISNVQTVVNWFEENAEPGEESNIQDLPCLPKCPCCGSEVSSAEEIRPTDYKGDGGIGIQYTDWVCDDCYSTYSCSYCGEFYGKDYEKFDNEGYCEYCYEKNSSHEKMPHEVDKDREDMMGNTNPLEYAQAMGYIEFDMDTIRYMLREFVITDFTVLDQFDEPKMREYFNSFDTELCLKYYDAHRELNHETLKITYNELEAVDVYTSNN